MRGLLAFLVLSTATVASAATAARPALESRKVPGYGVSLQLPPPWVGSPPPASAAALGVKYLFHAPEVIGSFRANVNLLLGSLPAGQTLRQWLFSGASASFQYAGTTTAVTIGGVRGLHYRSTRAVRFGTKALLTDEYVFARGRTVYLITYTALASTRSRYEPIFDASAKTIRFS